MCTIEGSKKWFQLIYTQTHSRFCTNVLIWMFQKVTPACTTLSSADGYQNWLHILYKCVPLKAPKNDSSWCIPKLTPDFVLVCSSECSKKWLQPLQHCVQMMDTKTDFKICNNVYSWRFKILTAASMTLFPADGYQNWFHILYKCIPLKALKSDNSWSIPKLTPDFVQMC